MAGVADLVDFIAQSVFLHIFRLEAPVHNVFYIVPKIV